MRRWADENQLTLIRTSLAGLRDWITWPTVAHRNLYRIAARDKTGRERVGLLRVGRAGWPALSIACCPVEVRWDAPKPTSFVASISGDRGMWDRDVD